MRRGASELVLGGVVGSLLILAGCSSCGPRHYRGVKVVDIIPLTLSAETNQDSEPFLAVHPTNPQLMVASAFTPNPGGAASGTAPIFVSQDGGSTWTLNNILPSASETRDITHAFDAGAGSLYSGLLADPGSLLLNELVSNNFTSPATMNVEAARSPVDQPFVRATSNGQASMVYVGSNDFTQLATSGHTATVDISANGGASFNSVRVESRATADISSCTPGHQDGPSIRPTFARDGVVYAAYFGWRSFSGSCTSATVTADVVVARDDHGGVGPNPFQALTDPADGQGGSRVAQSVTILWSNGPTLGLERTGSALAVAVDPNRSSTVYVAWADRAGNGGVQTLHVRRSTDGGAHWSADLLAVKDATNPALAVADNGTVGLLYQVHGGASTGGLWSTHLAQTRSAFSRRQDAVLALVPSDAPALQFLPYLGDYEELVAVGDEFRGIFAAANTPDLSHFPQGVIYQRSVDLTNKTLGDGAGGTVAASIDPYYFSFPVMQ